MSPEIVRLLFASGLSLFIGGFLGAYATRSIYGEPTADRPVPAREKTCPPCPECQVCPSCEVAEHEAVPTSTATRGALAPDPDEPEHERRPGLPASAMKLASQHVQAEIAPCLVEGAKEGAQGILLLDLTITATGSQGFISDVNIANRSTGTAASETLEHCILDAARHARFDWNDEEGEAHQRLPIKLGR